jgi:hypothetical protein
MEFKCNICNKNYASYQSLWNHNNIKHKDKRHELVNVSSTNRHHNVNTYKCCYCKDRFSSRQSKWYHQKNCPAKNIIVDKVQLIELEHENKKDIIILTHEKEKELLILNHQLKHSNELAITTTNSNNTNNLTNSNNTSQTNNGTVNNITINNIGKESIFKLTENEIKSLADKDLNAFTEIIKLLNFHKDRPENHNFCNTNINGDHVKVMNTETGKPQLEMKVDYYDKILLNSIRKLEELLIRLEHYNDEEFNINRKYIDKLEQIATRANDIIQSHKKVYRKNINKISYNNKEMVLDTWNKNINVEIISDEESLNHCSPDSLSDSDSN